MLPIIYVYVFPVNDYCNNRVSLDYRNDATKLLFFDDNDAITLPNVVNISLPNVVNDWLILFNYCKC